MKDRYLALNLRLFDTTINATTSNSSGNNLSAEMKTYYDNYLIDNAEPELVHDQFGQKRPIPKIVVKRSSSENIIHCQKP